MLAYKLFRVLASGDITSLFINKSRKLPYNEWLNAESYPTKGFALRPFWHCTSQPNAPHLSENGRIWLPVEMDDYTIFERPQLQGGRWYLANKIRILHG